MDKRGEEWREHGRESCDICEKGQLCSGVADGTVALVAGVVIVYSMPVPLPNVNVTDVPKVSRRKRTV